jgi:GxxExxY protein
VLGRGFLQSAYQTSLGCELRERGVRIEEQTPLPLSHKNVKLDCGNRLDIVVEDEIVVEIKAVEQLAPIHDAQLLSYLRHLGGEWGCSSIFTCQY